ncbi:hypothetical protein K450DRAFT_241781 [Umbelopsis ramanniana AG]|uniref:Guanine nucleotide-binding protein-like 1 n=1 Tax=Umbelopsis ramanniana AG TaxID=1314678 RepID=A0AAD5HEH9_UMBRA|nr:uncharacterized protein K450DRAFT_241781 [Umbelopsis ramanniana AG]KAI8579601.1 hypothetical protein K450DRAFT_241781 [Umbelopsis ramanniana AG]
MKQFVPAQTSAGTSRLRSVFEKLSTEVVERARLASMKPLQRLPQTALEVGITSDDKLIDFPKRPKWNYGMTKEQLEQNEKDEFEKWLNDIYERYGDHVQETSDGEQEELSWFEHNLEVWRQLWRVLEISDIILIIVDIRHPVLHLPTTLYRYVTEELGRKVVCVFNKIDLVAEKTVYAWRKYFEEVYPELHIATFSCFPRDENLIDDTSTYVLKTRLKRPRKRGYRATGVRDVLIACKDVHLDKQGVTVDWNTLIKNYDDESELPVDGTHLEDINDSDDDSETGSMDGLDDEFSGILNVTDHEVTPHKDYVTIGLVGHPNVGKSSLINSIMGRTVVSASRTPGHTKHFQTIHLTGNVRLCDSPGLVFPSLLPKPLQILSGMYPIAQVQEPYSTIQYLAERIPLEKILRLSPPDGDKNHSWSAWDICEEFAKDRGFYTAKAARPDVYRAANTLLRLSNDGRILLSFKPPGFFTTTKYELMKLREIEAQENEEDETEDESSDDESEEDDGAPVKITNIFEALENA